MHIAFYSYKCHTYFHIKVMVKLWMWLSTTPQRYIGAACKMWMQRITFILHFITPVNSLYNTIGQVQSTAGRCVGKKNKVCAFFRKWILILHWFVYLTELSLTHTRVGRNVLLIFEILKTEWIMANTDLGDVFLLR